MACNAGTRPGYQQQAYQAAANGASRRASSGCPASWRLMPAVCRAVLGRRVSMRSGARAWAVQRRRKGCAGVHVHTHDLERISNERALDLLAPRYSSALTSSVTIQLLSTRCAPARPGRRRKLHGRVSRRCREHVAAVRHCYAGTFEVLVAGNGAAARRGAGPTAHSGCAGSPARRWSASAGACCQM